MSYTGKLRAENQDGSFEKTIRLTSGEAFSTSLQLDLSEVDASYTLPKQPTLAICFGRKSTDFESIQIRDTNWKVPEKISAKDKIVLTWQGAPLDPSLRTLEVNDISLVAQREEGKDKDRSIRSVVLANKIHFNTITVQVRPHQERASDGFGESRCMANEDHLEGAVWVSPKETALNDQYENKFRLRLTWTGELKKGGLIYLDIPVYGQDLPNDLALTSEAAMEEIVVHFNKHDQKKREDDRGYGRWEVDKGKDYIERTADYVISYRRFTITVPDEVLKDPKQHIDIYLSEVKCPVNLVHSAEGYLRVAWPEITGPKGSPIDSTNSLKFYFDKQELPNIHYFTAEHSSCFYAIEEDQQILSSPSLDNIKLSWDISPGVETGMYSFFELEIVLGGKDFNNRLEPTSEGGKEGDRWSDATWTLKELSIANIQDNNTYRAYSNPVDYELKIYLRSNSKLVVSKKFQVKYQHILFVSDGSNIAALSEEALNGTLRGRSWKFAYRNLQEALDEVCNTDSDIPIWVSKGVYHPTKEHKGPQEVMDYTFYISNGIKLYGGFEGTEIRLEQRDPKKNRTVLSGSLSDLSFPGSFKIQVDEHGYLKEIEHNDPCVPNVVTINANENEQAIHIEGFTITGGSGVLGGGLFIENGQHIHLLNNLFIYNQANYGAAIGMGSGRAEDHLKKIQVEEIRNCQFFYNTADTEIVYLYDQWTKEQEGFEEHWKDQSPRKYVVNSIRSCHFFGNNAATQFVLRANVKVIDQCSFIKNKQVIYDFDLSISDLIFNEFKNSVFIGNQGGNKLLEVLGDREKEKVSLSNLFFYANELGGNERHNSLMEVGLRSTNRAVDISQYDVTLSHITALKNTIKSDNSSQQSSIRLMSNQFYMYSCILQDKVVSFYTAWFKKYSSSKSRDSDQRLSNDNHFDYLPKDVVPADQELNILHYAHPLFFVDDAYNFRALDTKIPGEISYDFSEDGFRFREMPRLDRDVLLRERTVSSANEHTIVGYRKLHFEKLKALKIGTKLTDSGMIIDESNASHLIDVMATTLTVKENSSTVQMGRIKNSNSGRITFEKPFAEKPKVILWIAELDLPLVHQSSYRLHTYVVENSVSTEGFEYVIKTWDKSEIGPIGLSWIAVPPGLANICAGDFESSYFYRISDYLARDGQCLDVVPVTFPKTAQMTDSKYLIFVGFNYIDFCVDGELKLNMDILHSDEKGFLVQMGSWGTSWMFQTKASYVTFPNEMICE